MTGSCSKKTDRKSPLLYNPLYQSVAWISISGHNPMDGRVYYLSTLIENVINQAIKATNSTEANAV